MYECIDCLGEWKESHGMTEEIEECSWCESKNIYRKPSEFVNLSKKVEHNRSSKVGVLTNEFIETSKSDLKRQKDELDKKR